MKFIYILFLIINIFSFNLCLFKNSKYIKELPNVAALDSELSKTNLTIGMMLIYSVHCGHCHTFAKTYEQIAEKYNKSMLFFAMNVYSDYYKRMPSTYGVPYILFFSDGYFYKYNRRRSFDEISYTIDKFYLTKCREITYKNIENVYYNVFLKNKNIYNNLIIGYFDDNSNNDIESFKNSNELMCPECVGLCYICKDFKENKNINNTMTKYIKNRIIVGYLQNNNSKIFLWENNKNKNIPDLEKYKHESLNNNIEPSIFKNYENFINNELKLEYYIIDNENKEYLINFLRNKNNLFFSYITNNQKKIYEDNINELINISNKTILSIYNLVLYKYSQTYGNNLTYITSNAIYEIDQVLNLTKKFNNYEDIKNKIIFQNIKNKEKEEINNKPLIPEVKPEDKNSFENQNPNPNDFYIEDFIFKVLERVCVILFTIVITFAVFFFIHYKYYSNIDEEQLRLIKNRK